MDVENKQQNSGIVPYPQVDIKQEKADEVGEDLQSVKIEVKEEVQDDSYGTRAVLPANLSHKAQEWICIFLESLLTDLFSQIFV
uniref:Uncharacterized protein n=1 Tax=Ditylenchus dipsaci TaxID=166011 RepID=A0A915DIZ5_9BILA